jgi:hypothetical protein
LRAPTETDTSAAEETPTHGGLTKKAGTWTPRIFWKKQKRRDGTMSNYKKLILVLILAWTFMVGFTCGFIFDSFCCVREAGAEELPAPRLTLIFEDDQGQKHFGHTPPTVDGVKLEDGMLYITYRQYPLFTYEDEMPTAHIYRHVYQADIENGGWLVIKLLRVENARVTPPKEIEERIEWP